MRKQIVGWMVAGVLALLLSIPAQAQAAYEFYVTIDGVAQGIFKGESMRKGAENKIAGVRFQYAVQSPMDIATGQPAGVRQHQPIVITKQWGASSPQIYKAWATNEILRSVVIEFVRVNPLGKEYIFQVIKLTNSRIASIRQYANVANPGEPVYPIGLEDIAFVFQKIEIFNNDGKTQAVDDWTSARK